MADILFNEYVGDTLKIKMQLCPAKNQWFTTKKTMFLNVDQVIQAVTFLSPGWRSLNL